MNYQDAGRLKSEVHLHFRIISVFGVAFSVGPSLVTSDGFLVTNSGPAGEYGEYGEYGEKVR